MTKKIILMLSTILLFAGVAHSQEVKGYPEEYIEIERYIFKREPSMFSNFASYRLCGAVGDALVGSASEYRLNEFLKWLQDTTIARAVANKLGFRNLYAEPSTYYVTTDEHYMRGPSIFLLVDLEGDIIEMLLNEKKEKRARKEAEAKRIKDEEISRLDAWLKDEGVR